MAISIGDALLKVGVDTKDLERDFKGIGATIKKHNKAIGLAMTAAGAVILGGLALSLKAASDFEAAMREVNTMMGLSQEEFAAFSKEVQGLAATMGVDAVDSAKALYQAISAGVPEENAIEFLRIATKAAIGGVTDTATAVDGLTTVINAFKMPISEAEHVADIMFTTVKGGKTTMEELSASMFQVAPLASAAGVKFETVAAALATMTKQGVPTSVATTQLRQAIQATIKPTAEMKEALDQLGYASGDALIAEEGLAGALELLSQASAGSTETLGKMFGSVEALQAVMALTGKNTQMFTADLLAMSEAAGASEAAFLEMEESTSRQMEKLKVSFKDIAITVGNVLIPVLKDIVDKIKPIIDSIGEWLSKNEGLTEVIVIMGGAVGALMFALGPLILALPGLIAAYGILTGVIWTHVAALWAKVAAELAALAATGIGIPIAIAAAAAIGILTTGIILLAKSQMAGVDSAKHLTMSTVGLGIETAKLKEEELLVLATREQLNKVYDQGRITLEQYTRALRELTATEKMATEKAAGWTFATFPFPEMLGAAARVTMGAQAAGMQHGGIAMRPITTRIAEKSPEAVIPLDKFERMIGGGRTVNIFVELDGRTIAQSVGQPLVDEIRLRTGVRI